MKKFLIVLTAGLILLGCVNKKSDSEYYAEMMVKHINHYSKSIDADIEMLQKQIRLNSEQTEILYMAKRDLMSKIPDLRQMIYKIQMKTISILEKDTIQKEDVSAVFKEADIYNLVVRDAIIKNLITLHDTMTPEQKQKFAKIVDGRGMVFMAPQIKFMPTNLFLKKYLEFRKDFKLTQGQLKEIFVNMNGIKKNFMNNGKIFAGKFKELKIFVKDLILSDKIDIGIIDQKIAAETTQYDAMSSDNAAKLANILNTLTPEQKKSLIKFISGFDFI